MCNKHKWTNERTNETLILLNSPASAIDCVPFNFLLTWKQRKTRKKGAERNILMEFKQIDFVVWKLQGWFLPHTPEDESPDHVRSPKSHRNYLHNMKDSRFAPFDWSNHVTAIGNVVKIILEFLEAVFIRSRLQEFCFLRQQEFRRVSRIFLGKDIWQQIAMRVKCVVDWAIKTRYSYELIKRQMRFIPTG